MMYDISLNWCFKIAAIQVAPFSTFSFLAYNLCSFQSILKIEYILEMSWDGPWSFYCLSFQNGVQSNIAPLVYFSLYTRWRHLDGHHFETSVYKKIIDHLKVFLKYIQLSKSDVNCKNNTLKLKYTRWRHFGLATILKYQLSKISYIISRHYQNVFIYPIRL
jgi:hypothetical protein